MRRLILPDSSGALSGNRRSAPSAERNFEPIAAVLAKHLPKTGTVLEIASGTGQHIAGFAQRFTGLHWQPSDVNPDNLATITAWTEQAVNVLPPIVLNACDTGWSQTHASYAAVCLTNLLHLISTPEAATLLAEVSNALIPGGVFCLYGPFRRDGQLVSDGDKAFDASLRRQDPDIGYKDIAWVEEELQRRGLERVALIEMPAANLVLITRRPAED